MSDPFAYARKGPGGSSAASSGMHYSHQAPTAPLTDPFAASGGGGWHNDTGGWGESSIGVSDVAAPQVGSMGRIGGAAPRPTASMPQPQPHYPPSAPHQPQQPHYPSSSPNVAVPAAAPSSSSSGGGLFNPALALAAAATFGAGGGAPGSGSPAELLQNPVAQLAMQKSQELVSSSVAKYLPGAHALWRSLRYYFRVSNSYCRAKLGRILFPFTTKKWARIPASEHDRAAAVASGDFDSFWSPPSKDTNAPDLYLPLMSLATYVLATGLLQGMSMKFHPDLLQTVLSRSFAVLLVEVAVLRFSLYALGVSAGGGGVSSLDLLAFGGYKFVALVINLLTGIFFGRLAYYMCFLYTSIAIFWFTTNTLMPLLRPELSSRGNSGGGGLSSAQTSQRNYLAIGAAALQCVLLWWMGSAPEASGGATGPAAPFVQLASEQAARAAAANGGSTY